VEVHVAGGEIVRQVREDAERHERGADPEGDRSVETDT